MCHLSNSYCAKFEAYMYSIYDILAISIIAWWNGLNVAKPFLGECIPRHRALSYYSDLTLSQNSSQWQHSFQLKRRCFQWKLRSHWLKFLQQRHVALVHVRQGPGRRAAPELTIEQRVVDIRRGIWRLSKMPGIKITKPMVLGGFLHVTTGSAIEIAFQISLTCKYWRLEYYICARRSTKI